ncbi:MAG: DNA mismatch repair endonuclease MutL [Lactobacillales bacterium]|nr:DNA mismatch repair endonuclease MutL [Lactobacillales bacterium]
MKIQELSEQLANQIAAGEVVERPASVVKELLENAIDAGSTQIEIRLEEAGMQKIEIVDNGEGIGRNDVLLAFKRHATSKIHHRDDLFRIRTLGFRGEALPSIASVSEIQLETAVATEKSGSLLVLKGGKVLKHTSAPLRQGTKIIVSNLFYNTPARLKYLRSLQTELAVISDIIHRLALSHPQIAFRLTHDGNQMLKTAGNGDLKTALAGIYGIANARKMLPLKSADLDVELSGYISLPELNRKSKKYLSLIINGRYIKNFQLNHAIIAGYGSKLMVDCFPIVVLKIMTDPLLVDVNVHPTKLEVRLSKEKELIALITKTIQETLASEQLIPERLKNLSFQKQEKAAVKESVEQSSLRLDSNDKSMPISTSSSVDYTNYLREKNLSQDYVEEADEQLIYDQESGKFLVNVNNTEVNRQFPELEYFAQMHGTYLFAQNEKGLYIIDQHAAQERIKYEYYREKLAEVNEDLQEMLLPIVLDYPLDDRIIIKEKEKFLQQVGIFLEDYGESSFILRQHPTWLSKGFEENLVREMIDFLLLKGMVNIKEFREKAAIMMSCKRSIKANHHLSDAEGRALITDLAKCQNPFNCPHGRPVLIHFSTTDMEKMFKRIVY